MPIYEFECVDCGAREEIILANYRNATAVERWCEDCDGQLHLVPSRPASFTVGKYGKAGGLRASNQE